MADTATTTATPARRTGPPVMREVNEIPQSSRKGFWVSEAEHLQGNPGVIRMYEGVSPTTASYLRKQFGLDAHSRNSRKNPNGAKGQIVDLYVKFDPERRDEIKAQAEARGAKAAEARAASKATKAAGATKVAGKAG